MTRRHYAARLAGSGHPLEVRPVEPRIPGAGHVRIDVRASGVCGADRASLREADPVLGLPHVPGHEIAGVVAEVGPLAGDWKAGDRVAVGWFGGSCGECIACTLDDVVHCRRRQVPGQSYDGGWATTVTVPAASLARVPDELSLVDAAPFGCAGVTAFNAVRRFAAPTGARIAILGLGGVGHLAVQFAAAMGHEVIVLNRGPEKRHAALCLGAQAYVDLDLHSPGPALRALGLVDMVISTASSSDVLVDVMDGLTARGQLVVVGFDASPLELDLSRLVAHSRSVAGQITGSPGETEAAMAFAVTNDVRPVVRISPLSEIGEAVAAGPFASSAFRTVLVPDA
ncbi:alcohol dehydrogenase catalytic domain-containing protein [Nocardioides sp. YIM 152315]|uniref:alcohol dehydrogenase catalytic domain-containing protein n=1 Tax=Nocardioides sp. YIM 152315 TaxID=3031760 RepID=UPI0023DA61F6|nr:alcohol dehydrogenase catalytic domain-containing protein [Nocardioides sp. YIM 152315]MDF1605859.1 alcohol dehydrogenase catalytic domain-containing protein [Nocardioides sp. YIM 152315]